MGIDLLLLSTGVLLHTLTLPPIRQRGTPNLHGVKPCSSLIDTHLLSGRVKPISSFTRFVIVTVP